MSNGQYPGDVQFAGLVQAATAAADQETQWEDYRSSSTNDRGPSQEYGNLTAGSEGTSMQPYAQTRSYNHAPPPTSSRKRKRSERAANTEADVQGQYSPAIAQDQSSIAQASAALFREPSTSSKKYTRPPMSTLFTSLQLSPESFLRMQAAAKEFMLNPDHPERRDCVGQRGRGDTDLVKLKLWNTVKEFLTEEGNGDQYFGEEVLDVGEAPNRSLFWPRDAQQIIKLCVPLLRKMVTNERQRKYAVESRKGPEPAVQETSSPDIEDVLGEGCIPSASEAANWYRDHDQQQELHHFWTMSGLEEMKFRSLVASIVGHLQSHQKAGRGECEAACRARPLDKLRSWEESQNRSGQSVSDQLFHFLQSELKAGLPGSYGAAQPVQVPAQSSMLSSADRASSRIARSRHGNAANGSATSGQTGTLMLHISLVESSSAGAGKRIAPRFSVTAESAKNLAMLRSSVEKHCDNVLSAGAKDRLGNAFSIKVWLPDGLVPVRDDGEWMVALLSAGTFDWMDGELRVLIEA